MYTYKYINTLYHNNNNIQIHYFNSVHIQTQCIQLMFVFNLCSQTLTNNDIA